MIARTLRASWVSLGILLSAAALPAQDSTLRLPDNAVVDVTLRSGKLIVRGTDQATGSVRGNGRNYSIRQSGVGIMVNSRNSGSNSGSNSGRNSGSNSGNNRNRDRDDDDDALQLDLPRGVRLIVNTSTADIDLRDLRGDVEVKTTSGDLVADNLSGRLFVDTFSGDVDVVGTLTALRATTVSGDVRVRGVRGEVELKTTSGEMRIAGDRITRVSGESITGDIIIDGGLADDARVSITTHSADIMLRLPNNARGSFDFTTINGDLDGGGVLTMMPGELSGARNRRATRRYEIGGGGPLRIDLSTSNGNVRFARGNRA